MSFFTIEKIHIYFHEFYVEYCYSIQFCLLIGTLLVNWMLSKPAQGLSRVNTYTL